MYEDITDKEEKYISAVTGSSLEEQPIGFSIAYAEDLFAPGTSNGIFRSGELYGLCTKISPDEGIFSCQLDFHFNRGTVLTAGILRFKGHGNFSGYGSRLAIVGGTGTYEGASGSILHFWRQDNGNYDNFQVSFTLV